MDGRSDSLRAPGYAALMVLYLHGFASGPGSAKGKVIAERFARIGIHVERPDLTPGEMGFERSSPSSMLAVAEDCLRSAPPPHVVIGSSLGGYLAALAASRGSRVERLVLLAPAFRLAERWLTRLSADEIRAWREEGLETTHFATGTRRRIGFGFMEDALRWPAYPEVRVPTLCIAGRRDEVVPLADVEQFVARTPGARLIVAEDGHELTASIDAIWEATRSFVASVTGG